MEFVIITGMSGAGKSQAVAALEDIGYYCVDNLPPRLLRSFAGLCMQAENQTDKVAIVMDVRSREVFGDIFEGVSSSWTTGVRRGFYSWTARIQS